MSCHHACMLVVTQHRRKRSLQETRQYLVWDKEGEEDTMDDVTTQLFEAADAAEDEEPTKKTKKASGKSGKKQKASHKKKKQAKKGGKKKKAKKSSSSSTQSSSSSSASNDSSDEPDSSESEARLPTTCLKSWSRFTCCLIASIWFISSIIIDDPSWMGLHNLAS